MITCGLIRPPGSDERPPYLPAPYPPNTMSGLLSFFLNLFNGTGTGGGNNGGHTDPHRPDGPILD